MEFKKIDINKIIPDPNQPRNLPTLESLRNLIKTGDSRANEIWNSLSKLASSIADSGLENPIIVYPFKDSNNYIIYDGHRRWMALKILKEQGIGDGKALCQIRPSLEEKDKLISQLNVNLQRKEFNIFELARSLRNIHRDLQENGGSLRVARDDGSIELIELLPEESDEIIWQLLDQKMGISRPRRYQIQAVLKLHQRIQNLAEKANVPEGKLRLIIPIGDESLQENILKEIIKTNLSIAEIKKRIKDLQSDSDNKSKMQTMPTPVQIRSAIKPIHILASRVANAENIVKEISRKDPRTVKGYLNVIKELKTTKNEIIKIISSIEYLDSE